MSVMSALFDSFDELTRLSLHPRMSVPTLERKERAVRNILISAQLRLVCCARKSPSHTMCQPRMNRAGFQPLHKGLCGNQHKVWKIILKWLDPSPYINPFVKESTTLHITLQPQYRKQWQAVRDIIHYPCPSYRSIWLDTLPRLKYLLELNIQVRMASL